MRAFIVLVSLMGLPGSGGDLLRPPPAGTGATTTPTTSSAQNLHVWLAAQLRHFPTEASKAAYRHHIDALLWHGVDRDSLRDRPVEWVQARLQLPATALADDNKGSTAVRFEASEAVCQISVKHLVGNATLLWESGRPGPALETLRAAADIGGQCCMPYREFSR